jgi:hypothetical protein
VSKHGTVCDGFYVWSVIYAVLYLRKMSFLHVLCQGLSYFSSRHNAFQQWDVTDTEICCPLCSVTCVSATKLRCQLLFFCCNV